MLPNRKRFIRRSERPADGFTLLEVLVAFLLMAFVTLAAAMALRLAVDANERIEGEGDSRQVLTVLPEMLAKQLAAVRTVSGTTVQLPSAATADTVAKAVGAGLILSDETPFAVFTGTDRYLSFLTAFSRQGSTFQGLTWVEYVYDEASQSLSIYQQTVTKIDETSGAGTVEAKRSRKARQAFEPELVGKIEQVTRFKLSYSEDPEADPGDRSAWEEEWGSADLLNPIDIGVPARVALYLEIGEGKGKRDGRWVFPVGYSIHFAG
ncbi:MAG: prepilin-type N-terminal cleavage/methylation domain-containing protein [Thermodesulfobacteriota bacterium]